jgi:hypothetical protein
MNNVAVESDVASLEACLKHMRIATLQPVEDLVVV